jgi:orotate phosphoribosyltransferase-like protein
VKTLAKKNPTVLQMDIVGLWVMGLSTREIANKLDCSDETVRLVKKNDDLKQIYYDRQREQVIDLIPLAVKRLRTILRDDEVQATAQIAAVREVFERARLTELTENADNEIKITVSYE